MFKVPNQYRVRCHPLLGSDESYGNNGLFQFRFGEEVVSCVASDQQGFEHVSVTINKKQTPSWKVMSHVKDLFWHEEDCVIQFHPPKSVYVNCHPYCLHLWRNEQIQSIMIPPKSLIG
jgi:hypothetical protein